MLLHRQMPWLEWATMAKSQNNIEALAAQLAEARSHNERLRGELLHLQKLEAVGRLSAGVAHDFNNVLTGIRGHVELALQELADGGDTSKDLETIKLLSDKGAALTRQLLAFSRRSEIVPIVQDAHVLVRETVATLSRIIGERFSIECHSCSGEALIRTIPGQLEQVLYNLMLNARDSMPDGGTITVAVSREEPDEEAPPGLEGADRVEIAVSDEGLGMESDTMDKAFDAFFTTKEVGKGTGLGLSVVKDIIESQNGHVHAVSELGKGSTFSVHVPSAGPRASVGHDASPEPQSLSLGDHETIMVVEDEKSVRLLMRDMLVALRYKVVVAENGAHALRLLDDQVEAIDMVISDVVMPVMGGMELARELARLHPEMKIIHTSGYRCDEIDTDRAGLRPGHFLNKPFSILKLSQKVREALAGVVMPPCDLPDAPAEDPDEAQPNNRQ